VRITATHDARSTSGPQATPLSVVCYLLAMAKPMEEKVLLGEAAEHLVLAMLLRHGYVAGQAPRGWKADDILGRGDLRVQVKATVKGTKQGWLVGDVDVDPKRFYALVDFADEAAPRIYVVPSCIVRDAAEASHREFSRLHPHADPATTMRQIKDPFPYEVGGYPPGWLQKFHNGWTGLGPV
jgi:hypothetical protein